MGRYSIVAEVSEAIAGILRKELVPEVIAAADGIQVCSPSEKGDAVLCIFLYDVTANEWTQGADMVTLDTGRQRYPSTYFNLFYMIMAVSSGDVKYRAVEEQKILGMAMQVLGDNRYLSKDRLEPVHLYDTYNIQIELLSLSNEEKHRILSMPGIPYRVAAFYKVSPVEMESAKERTIARVQEVKMGLDQKTTLEQKTSAGEKTWIKHMLFRKK